MNYASKKAAQRKRRKDGLEEVRALELVAEGTRRDVPSNVVQFKPESA